MNLRPIIPLALALACGFAQSALAYEPGDAPKFEFKTTDNKTLSPETLHGYLVAIIFWDSTDEFTVDKAGTIVPQYEAFIRRGVQIVGYNLDKEVKNFQKVMKEKKLPWPQVSDPRGFQSPVVAAWKLPKAPPYAFLLSPEGNLLWAGHASALANNLDEALAKSPPQLDRKVWIDLGVRQLKEVQRLLEANKDNQDYRKPLELLGQITQPIFDDPGIVALSRKIVPYFDSKKDADKYSLSGYVDTYPDGKKVLDEMRASLAKPATTRPGTTRPAALTASERREATAKQRLATADNLREAERHTEAYRAYRQIAKTYAGTAAAKSAEDQLKKYEADEKFMAALKRAGAEQEAKSMLSDAAGYRAAGKEDLAVKTYQKVIEQYPDTEWATAAKKALEKP